MMVLKSHLELMNDDGYVFTYILNEHPSMEKERSPLISPNTNFPCF